MRVLLVGGTGVLSSACCRHALRSGMDVTLLCRGKTDRHAVPDGAAVLHADVHDAPAAVAALGNRTFDAVVQFVGMRPEHVASDIEVFAPRTGQYVYISSASVYAQVPRGTRITEECAATTNPGWAYARDKLACESALRRAWAERRFPATIVRPSHTYDAAMLPLRGGYAVIDRLVRGRPVVVHGDGTSLWTLTHHDDFAAGLVGLLGQAGAIGETIHITSEEVLTWDAIVDALAAPLGVEPDIVHAPAHVIRAVDEGWGDSVAGDKAHDKAFDNAKLRRLVPGFEARVRYAEGAREQVAWYMADPLRQVVDPAADAVLERVIARLRA